MLDLNMSCGARSVFRGILQVFAHLFTNRTVTGADGLRYLVNDGASKLNMLAPIAITLPTEFTWDGNSVADLNIDAYPDNLQVRDNNGQLELLIYQLTRNITDFKLDSNHWVSIPAITLTTPHIVWKDAISASPIATIQLFGVQLDPNDRIQLLTDGRIVWRLGGKTVTFTVSATYDGDVHTRELKKVGNDFIYIEDGIIIETISSTLAGSQLYDIDSIGNSNTAIELDGYIFDVEIYDGAVLQRKYDLDEDWSTLTVVDSSGNLQDGTAVNITPSDASLITLTVSDNVPLPRIEPPTYTISSITDTTVSGVVSSENVSVDGFKVFMDGVQKQVTDATGVFSFTATNQQYYDFSASAQIGNSTSQETDDLYVRVINGGEPVVPTKPVKLWWQSGQSLSIGGGNPVIGRVHAAPLAGALMFNAVEPTSKEDTPIESAWVDYFVAYQENPLRETHGYAALNKVVNASYDWLYASHGMGGQSITQLSKGTVMYENGVLMAQSAKSICDSASVAYEIPFIDYIQGEADHTDGTTRADYVTLQEQLHTDYKAEAKTITGQTGLHMIIDQLGKEYATEIAKAQWEFSRDNADVSLACPKYPLNRIYNRSATDYIHLSEDGYIIQGEYHGLAAKSVIDTGSFTPLSPSTFSIVGFKIIITFNGRVGALTLDSTNLPLCPAYGFKYIRPDLSEIIPTVTLSGVDKIVLDLGEAPQVGGKVDYGWTLDDKANTNNVRLPCGNLRDSQSIASEVAGYTLNNWLVQFDYVL